MATYKENLKAAADAAMNAVSALDMAEGGDATGVPQETQDIINSMVEGNEADESNSASVGTFTAMANQLNKLADALPDPS